MRGLRCDSMSGLRSGRLDRRLYERNSPTARAAESAAQGSHRPLGACLSALCAPRPADRIPARDAALVGLLAQGHRYRCNGRAHAARMDDGQRETRVPARDVAGPLGRGAFMATAGNNAPTFVLDRPGPARRSGNLYSSRGVLAADGRQLRRRVGSVRPRTRSSRRSRGRRRALARVRHRTARNANRDARRGDRHARGRIRQAGGEPGGPLVRPASRRRIAARQLRRAQPRASRRARESRAAGGRAALPGAHPAQRRGRGVSGRP